MVEYLDLVGKIHTPAAGSQTLDVPLVQMNALLGFVSTAFLNTIVSCGLESRGTVCRWSVWFEKSKAVRVVHRSHQSSTEEQPLTSSMQEVRELRDRIQPN